MSEDAEQQRKASRTFQAALQASLSIPLNINVEDLVGPLTARREEEKRAKKVEKDTSRQAKEPTIPSTGDIEIEAEKEKRVRETKTKKDSQPEIVVQATRVQFGDVTEIPTLEVSPSQVPGTSTGGQTGILTKTILKGKSTGTVPQQSFDMQVYHPVIADNISRHLYKHTVDTGPFEKNIDDICYQDFQNLQSVKEGLALLKQLEEGMESIARKQADAMPHIIDGLNEDFNMTLHLLDEQSKANNYQDLHGYGYCQVLSHHEKETLNKPQPQDLRKYRALQKKENDLRKELEAARALDESYRNPQDYQRQLEQAEGYDQMGPFQRRMLLNSLEMTHVEKAQAAFQKARELSLKLDNVIEENRKKIIARNVDASLLSSETDAVLVNENRNQVRLEKNKSNCKVWKEIKALKQCEMYGRAILHKHDTLGITEKDKEDAKYQDMDEESQHEWRLQKLREIVKKREAYLFALMHLEGNSAQILEHLDTKNIDMTDFPDVSFLLEFKSGMDLGANPFFSPPMSTSAKTVQGRSPPPSRSKTQSETSTPLQSPIGDPEIPAGPSSSHSAAATTSTLPVPLASHMMPSNEVEVTLGVDDSDQGEVEITHVETHGQWEVDDWGPSGVQQEGYDSPLIDVVGFTPPGSPGPAQHDTRQQDRLSPHPKSMPGPSTPGSTELPTTPPQNTTPQASTTPPPTTPPQSTSPQASSTPPPNTPPQSTSPQASAAPPSTKPPQSTTPQPSPPEQSRAPKSTPPPAKTKLPNTQQPVTESMRQTRSARRSATPTSTAGTPRTYRTRSRTRERTTPTMPSRADFECLSVSTSALVDYSNVKAKAEQLRTRSMEMRSWLKEFTVGDKVYQAEKADISRQCSDARHICNERADLYRMHRLIQADPHLYRGSKPDSKVAQEIRKIVPEAILEEYRAAMQYVEMVGSYGSEDIFTATDKAECGWFEAAEEDKKKVEANYMRDKPKRVHRLWSEHVSKHDAFVRHLCEHYSDIRDNITELVEENLININPSLVGLKQGIECQIVTWREAESKLEEAENTRQSRAQIEEFEMEAIRQKKLLVEEQDNFSRSVLKEIEQNSKALYNILSEEIGYTASMAQEHEDFMRQHTPAPPSPQPQPQGRTGSKGKKSNTQPDNNSQSGSRQGSQVKEPRVPNQGKNSSTKKSKEATSGDKGTARKSVSGDDDQRIQPSAIGYKYLQPKDLFKTLKEFDPAGAIEINPNEVFNPKHEELYVFKGTGDMKEDLLFVMHADKYAWKNHGKNHHPAKGHPNFWHMQKSRQDLDDRLKASEDLQKVTAVDVGKNLIAVHMKGDTAKAIRKKDVLEHNLQKRSKRLEFMRRVKHAAGRKGKCLPDVLPSQLPDNIEEKNVKENFSNILTQQGKPKLQDKPTTLKKAAPLQTGDKKQKITNHQIAQLLKACKVAYDAKELPCAKSNYLSHPKGGETYAFHTYNYQHDKGTSKKMKENYGWMRNIHTDGYKWGTQSVDYEHYKDRGGNEYNVMHSRYNAGSEKGYKAQFTKNIYLDYENCTMIIRYTGDERLAEKREGHHLSDLESSDEEASTQQSQSTRSSREHTKRARSSSGSDFEPPQPKSAKKHKSRRQGAGQHESKSTRRTQSKEHILDDPSCDFDKTQPPRRENQGTEPSSGEPGAGIGEKKMEEKEKDCKGPKTTQESTLSGDDTTTPNIPASNTGSTSQERQETKPTIDDSRQPGEATVTPVGSTCSPTHGGVTTPHVEVMSSPDTLQTIYDGGPDMHQATGPSESSAQKGETDTKQATYARYHASSDDEMEIVVETGETSFDEAGEQIAGDIRKSPNGNAYLDDTGMELASDQTQHLQDIPGEAGEMVTPPTEARLPSTPADTTPKESKVSEKRKEHSSEEDFELHLPEPEYVTPPVSADDDEIAKRPTQRRQRKKKKVVKIKMKGFVTPTKKGKGNNSPSKKVSDKEGETKAERTGGLDEPELTASKGEPTGILQPEMSESEQKESEALPPSTSSKLKAETSDPKQSSIGPLRKQRSLRRSSSDLGARELGEDTTPTKLKVGGKVIYKLENGEQIAMACKQPGFAVILKNKSTPIPQYVKDKAAESVADTAVMPRKGSNVAALVGVKNTRFTSMDLAADDFLHMRSAVKPSSYYSLDCHCGKPTNHDDRQETMTMCKGKCKKFYHKTCVDTDGEDKRFICDPCKLKTKGIEWSADHTSGFGALNTCSQDNCWNAFLLEAEGNPELAQQLHDIYFGPHNIPFKEVFEKFQQGQDAQAQLDWYIHMDNVKKEIPMVATNMDCKGTEKEMIVNYLHPATKIYHHFHCSTANCNEKTSYDVSNFVLPVMGNGEEPDEPIQSALNPQNTPECEACETPMTFSGIDPGTPPAYLLQFNTETQGAQHIMDNYPKNISVGDKDYHLKYILLQNEKKQHFTSLVRHNDKWLFYDDMADANRIRQPLKSDYEGFLQEEGFKVDNVTYFLDQKHLQI